MARKRTEAAESPHKTYTVTYPHGLNLRAEPSKQSEILRVLRAGETVTERDAKSPDGWIAVNDGYVMREYLK